MGDQDMKEGGIYKKNRVFREKDQDINIKK